MEIDKRTMNKIEYELETRKEIIEAIEELEKEWKPSVASYLLKEIKTEQETAIKRLETIQKIR